jgi:signal transduction histidine kinase
VADAIGRAVFGVVFETTAEAALIADRDTWRVVSANQRACELLARRRSQMIGVVIDDVLAGANLDVSITHVDVPAHGPLSAVTLRDVAAQNRKVAMLAWRAAMGEVVSGVAHHINNPVAALLSTLRRLRASIGKLPSELRTELDALYLRLDTLAQRIDRKVALIVSASRSDGIMGFESGHELPPELVAALSSFSGRLDDLQRREIV